MHAVSVQAHPQGMPPSVALPVIRRALDTSAVHTPTAQNRCGASGWLPGTSNGGAVGAGVLLVTIINTDREAERERAIGNSAQETSTPSIEL